MMTGWHHLKLLILVALGILLLSAGGLSACYQAAPTTPATPAPTEEKAAAPEEKAANSQEPVQPQQPAAIKVELSGFAFVPATITVPVGATVVWTNKDSVTHTVTSRDGLFDSGNWPVGATFSYTFKQAGSFRYYCKIHPSITGEIIVGEGTTAPSGSTTTPAGGTTAPPAGTTSPPGGTTTSPPQQTPTALTVDISGFAFSPATITVPVGTTVTWTNKDITHTVSSRTGLFDSGNLPRGATFSYTFNEKGTFDYYCKIHPSITGKVIVGEGTTSSTSGTTTPTPSGNSSGSSGSSSDYDY